MKLDCFITLEYIREALEYYQLVSDIPRVLIWDVINYCFDMYKINVYVKTVIENHEKYKV